MSQIKQAPDLKAVQVLNPEKTLIRIDDVAALTGLARGTIYKRLKADPTFPRPVPLSDSKAHSAPVGWVLAEVQEWVTSRIAKRDQEVSKCTI